MDRDVAVARQRLADLGLRLLGHELILGRDVHEQWLGDGARLAEVVVDADAIVADIAIGVRSGRHQIGELTAEAVADAAGLAGAFRQPAQMVEAGDQVLDALGHVEALEELEGPLPLRVRLVGDLDARLLPPE
jgi:hypothetical protein